MRRVVGTWGWEPTLAPSIPCGFNPPSELPPAPFPAQVQSFNIHNGERTDVVVCMDQDPGCPPPPTYVPTTPFACGRPTLSVYQPTPTHTFLANAQYAPRTVPAGQVPTARYLTP